LQISLHNLQISLSLCRYSYKDTTKITNCAGKFAYPDILVIMDYEVIDMVTFLAILVVLAFLFGLAVLAIAFFKGNAGKTDTIIDDINKK